MIKRSTDIVLASLGLLLTSPLFIVAAILVKATSAGPIFFHQRRIGRHFKPFEVLKFRTMVRDAPVIGGSLTVAGDARITRVGGWLRMSKIDELPQLINVLRGEMSIVGPRPEVEEYVLAFPDEYGRILNVRPGVTDLASIRYRSEEVVLAAAENPAREYVETILPLKLRLAEEYIQRSSFFFDLGIVIRTIAQIFLRAGTLDVRPSREIDGGSRAGLHFHRVRMVTAQLVAVVIANYLAFAIRFEWQIPPENLAAMWMAMAWVVAVRGLTFLPFRLYHGIWRYSGVYDLLGVVGATTVSSAVLMVGTQLTFGPSAYPKSVVVMDGILLMLALSAMRLIPRLVDEVIRLPAPTERVLIYGAGDAGERLARDMRQNPSDGYRAVGFIDDNPQKRGRHIHGVRVLGGRTELPDVLARLQPDAILMAMPHAEPSAIRAIVRLAEAQRVPVRTIDGDASHGRGKIDLEAALRRLASHSSMLADPANQKLLTILRNSRVMVAGAGGTIGAELCRQLGRFRPGSIIAIDRHQGSLTALMVQLETERRSTEIVPIVVDVGNQRAISEVIRRFHPTVVLFAAGHGCHGAQMIEADELLRNDIHAMAAFIRSCNELRIHRLVYLSGPDAAVADSPVGVAARVREQLVLQSLDPANLHGGQVIRVPDPLDPERLLDAGIFRQMLSGGPVVIPGGAWESGGLVTPLIQKVMAIVASGQPGLCGVVPVPVSAASLFKDALCPHGGVSASAIRVEVGEEFAGGMRSIFHRAESLTETAIDGVVRIDSGQHFQQEATLAARLLAGQDLSLDDIESVLKPTAEIRAQRDILPPADLPILTEFRGPCPACGNARLRRSRARGVIETMRRRNSERRPYVCENCRWRGWLNPGLLGVVQIPKRNVDSV